MTKKGDYIGLAFVIAYVTSFLDDHANLIHHFFGSDVCLNDVVVICMTKNPLLNAGTATLYISVVASIMYYGPKFVRHDESVESVIVPIAMLSLFVLSTAVMGSIFCLEPIKQYFAGRKEASVKLFLKTVGYFGLITLFVFCALFLIAR